tara:strand:+ start:2476 stop:3546 length:1071 start_codon:yes stop_codon:yes gene_type:complete
MPLEKVHLENFRLFKNKVLSFSNGTNLILGENGSGKTSILEAINILLSGNSFRAKDTKECIKLDKDFFLIAGKGMLGDKLLTLKVNNGLNSRLKSSRILEDSAISKDKTYFLQLVVAKNLKMIDGEPDLRREYFNELMFHVKPETKRIYTNYQKALKHRNKCLKNKVPESELLLWTDEVSRAGLELSLQQYEFFKIFKENITDYIKAVTESGVFTFLDGLDLRFTKGWERTKKLEESLEESLLKDKVLGYSSKGPHRMDITFKVHNKMASSNLSRGQLKILILLVFLSNIILIENYANKEVLLLIDDLSSELDLKNLTSIIEKIVATNKQIILTGIEGEEIHQSIKDLTNFTQINL